MMSNTSEQTGNRNYLPEILRHVNLKNDDGPIYVVGSSFNEIRHAVREYEIENTVHFVKTRKRDDSFNANIVPWLDDKRSAKPPKLIYSSKIVPDSNKPFIKVSSCDYDCQFGKRKNREEVCRGVRALKASCKIGCTAKIYVEEVIRFHSPVMLYTGSASQKERNRFARSIKEQLLEEVASVGGMEVTCKAPLKWKREFHMLISPLGEHAHVTGCDAGPKMRLDEELRNRIKDMARAGITARDVIMQNIKHHVNNVLFKGRPPPDARNRRFNPTREDVKNAVLFVANKEQEKVPVHLATTAQGIVLKPVHEASSSNAQPSAENDIAELVEAARQLDDIQQKQKSEKNKQNIITYSYHHQRSDGAIVLHAQSHHTIAEQDVDLGAREEVTAELENSPEVSHVIPLKTDTTRKKFQSSKESCRYLLKQLDKIFSVLENDDDFLALSALLVNVILEAKCLVPKKNMAYVYDNETIPQLNSRQPKKHRGKLSRPKSAPIQKEEPKHLFLPLRKSNKHWSKRYQFTNDSNYTPRPELAETRMTPPANKVRKVNFIIKKGPLNTSSRKDSSVMSDKLTGDHTADLDECSEVHIEASEDATVSCAVTPKSKKSRSLLISAASQPDSEVQSNNITDASEKDEDYCAADNTSLTCYVSTANCVQATEGATSDEIATTTSVYAKSGPSGSESTQVENMTENTPLCTLARPTTPTTPTAADASQPVHRVSVDTSEQPMVASIAPIKAAHPQPSLSSQKLLKSTSAEATRLSTMSTTGIEQDKKTELPTDKPMANKLVNHQARTRSKMMTVVVVTDNPGPRTRARKRKASQWDG